MIVKITLAGQWTTWTFRVGIRNRAKRRRRTRRGRKKREGTARRPRDLLRAPRRHRCPLCNNGHGQGIRLWASPVAATKAPKAPKLRNP